MKIIGGVSAAYTVYLFAIKPIFRSIFKSIIEEEISQKRDEAIRYMDDAWRYMNEARKAEERIEQIEKVVARHKEEITKIAQTIDIQLSGSQDSEKSGSIASETKIGRGIDVDIFFSHADSTTQETTALRDILLREYPHMQDVKRINALAYLEYIMAQDAQSSETDQEDFNSFSKFLNYFKRSK